MKIKGMEDELLHVPTPAEMGRIVNSVTRAWAPSVIHAAVAHARDKQSGAIAASGKIKPLNHGVAIVFGEGTFRKGVPLRDITRQYEFGTGQSEQEGTYRSRSPRGKAFPVTRRVQRQIPRVRKTGRFLYPAVADRTPELTSRLVREILRVVVPHA